MSLFRHCLPGIAALLFVASFPVHADTFIWDGGAASSSWGSADNWDPNGVPTFNNTADIIFNSVGAANLSNFTGTGRTIRSLSFNENTDSDVTIRTTTTAAGTTAANLTFEADSGNASITVDSGAAASLITVGTAGGNIVLNSDLNIVHNGSGELLLGRPVTGAGGIIKSGAGVMRFNQQANSFTGNITINQGTLIDGGATAGGALGTGPKIITLGGGTLVFERNYAANSVMGDKSFITMAATSSIIRYNDLSAPTRNFTISGASESATLNGDLLVENISSSGGADVIVWNLATTGNGLFSYSGAQDDVLNNLNDLRFQVSGDLSLHVGGIEVRKGIWLANGASALGGGAINIGTTASADSAAITLNTNSATTISNAVNVRTGAGTRLIDTNTQTASTNWSGAFTLDGTLTYKSANADGFTSTSSINGSGGLVKLGTGLLDLRGDQGGYSGNITVSEGTVRTVNASAGSGAISVASGAQLNLTQTTGSRLFTNPMSGDGSLTIGGSQLVALSGSNTLAGDITITNNAALRVDDAAFNSSSANILNAGSNSLMRLNAATANQTLANTISGDGSVIKQGNFTTILTAANTYTGTTDVSAGTLIVNGNQGDANGTMTVASTATLGGTGTIGADLTTVNGTLSSGSSTATGSVGTLNFADPDVGGTADLSFGSGSFWLVDIVQGTNSSDLLAIEGILTIDPMAILTITPDTNLAYSTSSSYTLATYAGLSGAFSNYDHNTVYTIGGGDYLFSYGSGAITLTAVPEPQAFLLLLIPVCAVAYMKRRQTRLTPA